MSRDNFAGERNHNSRRKASFYRSLSRSGSDADKGATEEQGSPATSTGDRKHKTKMRKNARIPKEVGEGMGRLRHESEYEQRSILQGAQSSGRRLLATTTARRKESEARGKQKRQ